MHIKTEWRQTNDIVYVLDQNLNLVWANDAWERFARENNGEELLAPGARINAVTSCAGHHRSRWQSIYRSLLNDGITKYSEFFECPGPRIRRRFQLNIIRENDPEGGSILIHRTHLMFEQVIKDGEKDVPHSMQRYEPEDGQPIRACGLVRPLEGVGGDLVWMTWPEPNTAWLLIADAMGHDERAAKAVRRVRDLIQENLNGKPSRVLEAVNKAYTSERIDDENPIFVTGLLFRIDAVKRQVHTCAFGHNGFIATKGGLIEVEGGLPIGILEDAPNWPEQVLDADQIGRRSLTFTDGVFEQFDGNGKMFSMERIEAHFLRTAEYPLCESLEEIMKSVDRFRENAIIKDDQSLLAFELSP